MTKIWHSLLIICIICKLSIAQQPDQLRQRLVSKHPAQILAAHLPFQSQLHVHISAIPEKLLLSRAYQLNLPLTRVDIELDHKLSRSVAVNGNSADVSFSFKDLRAAFGHGKHPIENVKLTYYYRGFGKVVEYQTQSVKNQALVLASTGATHFKIGYFGILTPRHLDFKVQAQNNASRLAMNF